MALTLEQIPSNPFLVPEFKPTLAGVDFLNLRQVNLDLMGVCIPGTNNTTRRVRGYSLITWVYWVYPRILKNRGQEDASSEELIHFREKVESLFVWGHKLAGIRGLPGIDSIVPPEENGKVDLRFAAWKRSRVNTSFEAAVQYGPSLLDLGGLGLLHKIDTGIYACTRAGEMLGEAFDQQLRQCTSYEFLMEIDNLKGTADHATDLLPYWRIDETSPSEEKAFQSILWDHEHAEEKSPRGRRASIIELILVVLEKADESLDISEIRRRLALPGLWSENTLPPGQIQQCRSWLVLQLRQLQRLSLEALMSWLEVRLIKGGHQFPDQLVQEAVRIVNLDQGHSSDMTTEDHLSSLGSPFQKLTAFEEKMIGEPDKFCPWSLSSQLREAVVEQRNEVVTLAFHSLLFLYQCRPFLEGDKHLAKHLEHGGATRVSLAHWFRIVERFHSRPYRELIDWTLKNLVISQHLAVGTQRFDGLKIRLRMILEEEGLETLVRKPWQPDLTPDRLATLLSLLESCGIVTTTSNGGIEHFCSSQSILINCDLPP